MRYWATGSLLVTLLGCLKGIQAEAVDMMRENFLSGNPGSFMWMTVGSGKTMAVLLYVQWLIERGSMPPYFVYTLPQSALQSVVAEIQKFGMEIRLLVPLKNAQALEPFLKELRSL